MTNMDFKRPRQSVISFIAALLTMVVLSLSLAACGDATNTSSATTAALTTSNAATTATTAAAATTVAVSTAAPTTAVVTTAAPTTAVVTTAAPTTAATTTTAPATTASATTALASTTSASATTASAISASATTAASGTVAAAPATKIKVLATTTQVGDFARAIGGNRVEVAQILRPDDDPHDYDPTATDSKNAAAAGVVFKNGVGLDDWLDKIITNSGTKAPLVNLSEGIKLRAGKDESEKAGDPHIWHSTDNAKIMVTNLAKGLETADPTGKSYYEAQLADYTRKLDDLKTQINQTFAAVPNDQRKLVTNHDAFGYFADEFGITVVGEIIPNFSDAAQPTPQEINELIKNIKSNNVKAIFTETTINPKVAQQVAQAAGIKIYSNLYGDALGIPGSDGDTYLKMELSNAKNMAAGFTS